MSKDNEPESFYAEVSRSKWRHVYSSLILAAIFFVIDLSREQFLFPRTLGALTVTFLIFLGSLYYFKKQPDRNEENVSKNNESESIYSERMSEDNEPESFYAEVAKSKWRHVYSALICTAIFFVVDLSRAGVGFPMTLGGLSGTLVIFLVTLYYLQKKSEDHADT